MTQQNTAKKKISRPNRSPSTSDQKAFNKLQESARLVTDESGTIIFTNEAFQEITGNDIDLTGKNILDILSVGKASAKKSNKIDHIRNGLQKASLKVSKQEFSFQFDWVETSKNNKYLIVSAEDTATDSNASASNVFDDISTESQIIVDENGSIESANNAFESLIQKNTTDTKFIDLIYFQDQPLVEKYLCASKPVPFEARCVVNDSNLITMRWNYKIENNRTYLVGQNITTEAEISRLAQKHEKELSEAEAIGDLGQWRWEVGAEDLSLSAQIYQIFDINAEEFSPTLDNMNALIFKRDSGRMAQIFQRAIIEKNDYDVDFRISRPDGEIRYIKCEGRCEIDQAEDDVVALYGIMQDVTDTTLRELDLMKAKNSAERAYAAKTQFLANMSHELRTPLNAIIGFSEMMQRQLLGPIGTEKYLEYIGGIRESGEHLLDLISDILDMSKIEAGKYELSLEKFNISKLVRMAVHMMEGRALDSNIKIKVNAKNEERQIVADRRALMQMVLNLLSNAVKFSHPDSTVKISVIEREKYLSIKVEDQGIGIPANKLANITQPFEQVESHYTREYEGSGLGLAITKELAEIHGGSLHIESTLDVGTTVTIRIPYDATNERCDAR